MAQDHILSLYWKHLLLHPEGEVSLCQGWELGSQNAKQASLGMALALLHLQCKQHNEKKQPKNSPTQACPQNTQNLKTATVLHGRNKHEVAVPLGTISWGTCATKECGWDRATITTWCSWHALVTCLNPMARSDRDGGRGQVLAKWKKKTSRLSIRAYDHNNYNKATSRRILLSQLQGPCNALLDWQRLRQKDQGAACFHHVF